MKTKNKKLKIKCNHKFVRIAHYIVGPDSAHWSDEIIVLKCINCTKEREIHRDLTYRYNQIPEDGLNI